MMRKIIVLISSVILLCGFMNEEPQPLFCSPFYTGIDRVYLSYNANIPGIDNSIYDAVLDQVILYYSNILSKENIEIVKRKDTGVSLKENELELEFNHSFASKEGFSLPLKKDMLAFWFNKRKSHNYNVDDDAMWGLTIKSYLSKKNVDDQVLYLKSDLLSHSIQSELCLVTLHSRKKACPTSGKLPTRAFKEVVKECVVASEYDPSLKETEDYLKKAE